MDQMEQAMKKERAATSSAAHCDTETDSNFLKPDPGLLQSVKGELSFTSDALVKEEILEDSSLDDSEQQCVQITTASTGGVNEACSMSLGDLINVKYESAEIDIGPTVLQPMDIHYTSIKHNMSAAMEENTIVDDCSGAMPGSGGRKNSIQDNLRDNKTTSHNCAQRITEMDYDEAHMKSFLTPHVRLENKDLQKLLYRFRTTSSNSSKCDMIFHKPHLQSAPDKLRRRNSRRAVTTRGPVAGPSNENKDIRIKNNKKNSFTCDVCGKGNNSKSALNLHKRSHCRVKLKNRHTRKTHHTRAGKFAQSDDLNKQARFHTGEKPFQCETCYAKFSQRTHLTNHMRIHTGEKPFKCETCDAQFAHKCNLTEHMRVHTGEKPFQCETCHAKFSQRNNLTKHLKVHTGEKPFQCETCDAKFAHKCNLTKHMRVHSGDKPYQCKICHTRFAQSSSLTQHERVHTGEKPYQCETCHAKFSQNSILTKHMKVHMGEKPFQCETCDARFSQRGHLTLHMRVHTAEKP